MGFEIVQSESFNGVTCDFYQNEEGEVFMTTTQLGSALEDSHPRQAISRLLEETRT